MRKESFEEYFIKNHQRFPEEQIERVFSQKIFLERKMISTAFLVSLLCKMNEHPQTKNIPRPIIFKVLGRFLIEPYKVLYIALGDRAPYKKSI